jgi:putative restriction endonuclease
MKISEFFTDTLGANLRNKRWSWGAVDPMTNRVFLRVWQDNIETRPSVRPSSWGE